MRVDEERRAPPCADAGAARAWLWRYLLLEAPRARRRLAALAARAAGRPDPPPADGDAAGPERRAGV